MVGIATRQASPATASPAHASVTGVANAWLLERGTGSYAFAGQTIEFGPGRAEHRYTQLRGALTKRDAECVYLTGFTPFRATLRIA